MRVTSLEELPKAATGKLEKVALRFMVKEDFMMV
jgi:acyl-coenzyme A synthetase/AMP-(fatty) acid ligase